MTSGSEHTDNPSTNGSAQCGVTFLKASLTYIDTLLLDVSVPSARSISKEAQNQNCQVIPFRVDTPDSSASRDDSHDQDSAFEQQVRVVDDFTSASFDAFVRGETRVLLGPHLSKRCASENSLSYRIVTKGKTLLPSSELPLRRRRILHVMGSVASNFYEGISCYYGFSCIDHLSDKERFDHIVAYVHRDGAWSIGSDSPSRKYMTQDAPKMNLANAIAEITSLKVDAVLPHMFDYAGLTAFRALFDILQLPLMGCSAEALALSTNKMRTIAVAEKAGVPVSESQVIRKGDCSVTLEPPLVIKPTEEDNSLGISLVRTPEELQPALQKAFELGDEVLVERFVPLGMELRVAVLENANGEFRMLPCAEYILPQQKPIRMPQDKLTTDDATGSAKDPVKVERRIPAPLSVALEQRLKDAVVTAHHALGCRDYGIYDFRVDPDDNPYMLESCLYCSFASTSILVLMWLATGAPASDLFEMCVEWAIARRFVKSSASQRSGMKARD